MRKVDIIENTIENIPANNFIEPSKNNSTKRGARVMFLYPNERGMSTVPAAIAILSQLLKESGNTTSLFDTTFYKFDDELTPKGFSGEGTDTTMVKSLNYRPLAEEDDEDFFFKKTTRSAVKDFRTMIKKFKPDLIAVSTTESTFFRAMTLIKKTRKFGIPNIFGGVFPTFAPELVMKNEEIDMLCVGEGENTLLDLAECIRNGRNHSDVTNLWIRMRDGNIKRNSVTKPVDINKETPIKTDVGLFGEKRFYRPLGGKLRRLLPVETHRGCPYKCTFCNSPSQNTLYGGGVSFLRRKSIDNVRKELENHVKEWNIEYVYFWADTFLAWSNREFDEFHEMYSDFKLPFWCQTRTETVTEYRFKKLKEVGLDRVSFGMEHGNAKFRRKYLKRNYTNESAINNLKIVSDLEIPFAVNNIIGFPDETRELAFDTIQLNRQFKSDTVLASIFLPFHGTELRTLAEKRGYILPETICTATNSDESMLNMPQWDNNDISNLRNCFAMYVKFPKSRWPEIEKAESDPKLFEKLSEEYIEMCWANPRGKIEDDLAQAAKGIF